MTGAWGDDTVDLDRDAVEKKPPPHVKWKCGCNYTQGEGVNLCAPCYEQAFGEDDRSRK